MCCVYRTLEIPNAATTSESEVHEFLNKNKYELFTYLATFFIVGKNHC